MSEIAYHRDCYLTELETEVVSVGEEDGSPYVILADTLFYPEGGGQPADRGQLGGAEVWDVQKRGEEIRHLVSHPVADGPVRLKLDWSRRWDHMQQHTGQHVLTAVALRDFGWRTMAFHLGAEWSDIELDVPSLDRNDLDRLEEAVAKEISAARPVTTAISSALACDLASCPRASRELFGWSTSKASTSTPVVAPIAGPPQTWERFASSGPSPCAAAPGSSSLPAAVSDNGWRPTKIAISNFVDCSIPGTKSCPR